MRTARLLQIFFVFLGLSGATGLDLTLDQVVDLRVNSKEKNFVAFCSRPLDVGNATAGHAFIVIGQAADVGPTAITDSWGFWPDKHGDPSTLYSMIRPVPGGLAQEYMERQVPKGSCRLIVLYDKGSNAEVALLKTVGKWKDEKTYRLVLKDCVTFTADVASALKLNVPSRPTNLTPDAFIRALVQKNGTPAGLRNGVPSVP